MTRDATLYNWNKKQDRQHLAFHPHFALDTSVLGLLWVVVLTSIALQVFVIVTECEFVLIIRLFQGMLT